MKLYPSFWLLSTIACHSIWTAGRWWSSSFNISPIWLFSVSSGPLRLCARIGHRATSRWFSSKSTFFFPNVIVHKTSNTAAIELILFFFGPGRLGVHKVHIRSLTWFRFPFLSRHKFAREQAQHNFAFHSTTSHFPGLREESALLRSHLYRLMFETEDFKASQSPRKKLQQTRPQPSWSILWWISISIQLDTYHP